MFKENSGIGWFDKINFVANLQRRQGGKNADHRGSHDHDPTQINESEDENGERSENVEEHEFGFNEEDIG